MHPAPNFSAQYWAELGPDAVLSAWASQGLGKGAEPDEEPHMRLNADSAEERAAVSSPGQAAVLKLPPRALAVQTCMMSVARWTEGMAT